MKFPGGSISSYYIPKSGEKKDTHMIDHQPTSTSRRWCFFFAIFPCSFVGKKPPIWRSHMFFQNGCFSRPRCTTWRLDTEMGLPVESYFGRFFGWKIPGVSCWCCWWFRNLAFNQLYVDDILGGGFRYCLCSSRKLGKIPILTNIFKGVETTN